jgi:hypothetical protein
MCFWGKSGLRHQISIYTPGYQIVGQCRDTLLNVTSENGATKGMSCVIISATILVIRCVMTSFQLVGLAYEPFSPLFALSDAALSGINMRRVIATTKPGYPCRVSLADADVGDELLLLPFEHQPAASPYKASGPIFVRRAAVQASIESGVIPDYVGSRLMSVRAYDEAHLMTEAVVCAGGDTAAVIRKMFSGDDVAYIHLHNASRGCFSCAVNRA